MKKTLEGVIPFNEVYYANCLQLELFTVLSALKGNYLSFIANDFFHYKLIQGNEGYHLNYASIPMKTIEELLIQNGVIVECHLPTKEDLIEFLEENITKNRLMLVPLDLMYHKHPYHDLFYMKEHHIQYFTVFGFDSIKKSFQVVGVNGMNWDKDDFCYVQEMKYDEMITCYDSFLRMNEEGSNEEIKNDIKIFYKDESFSAIDEDLRDCVIGGLKRNKNELEQGLDKLKWMANNISQYELNTEYGFDNKVCSLSNLYKYKKIMKESWNQYYDSFKEIHNQWCTIEYLMYKYIEKSFDKLVFAKYMNRIYEIESRLYEQIYKEINL